MQMRLFHHQEHHAEFFGHVCLVLGSQPARHIVVLVWTQEIGKIPVAVCTPGAILFYTYISLHADGTVESAVFKRWTDNQGGQVSVRPMQFCRGEERGHFLWKKCSPL